MSICLLIFQIRDLRYRPHQKFSQLSRFFSILSYSPNSVPFYPANFLWNSKVPSKVKAFAQLVALKKVNTNNLLWLRRPFKALSLNWCILCRSSNETIDHLFLYCPIALGLWQRIFSQAGKEWVSLGTICYMMMISFKCFGNSFRGRALQRIACLSLLWIVWKERNARIFENTWRTSDSLWDSLHFFVSFWAYCTDIFKPYPLSAIQLSWLSICTRQGWVIGATVGLLVQAFLFFLYNRLCFAEVCLVTFDQVCFYEEDLSSFFCFSINTFVCF